MNKSEIVNKIDISVPEEKENKIRKKAGVTGESKDFQELSMPQANLIKQKDRLDSDDYNKQFHDIENDLDKIFTYAQAVDVRIEHNEDLNAENLRKMKELLKDIKLEIKKYETIVYDTDGFDDSKIETFDNDKHIEDYNHNSSSMFTDDSLPLSVREYLDETMEPEIFHKQELTKISDNHNIITLPPLESIESSNMIAVIEDQIGYNLIEDIDKINDVNNILNKDNKAVWSEVIQSQEPFSIQLDDNDIVNNQGFYGEKNGALCKARLIFDSAVPINEIFIDPLSEHPFELISIRSFPDTQSYLQNNPNVLLSPERAQRTLKVEDLKNVPGIELSDTGMDVQKILERENIEEINYWNVKKIRDLDGIKNERDKQIDYIYDFIQNTYPNNPHMKRQFLEDRITLQFEPVECKTLELCFKQEHYTKNQTVTSKEDKEKTKLMQSLFREKFQITSTIEKDNVNNILELDRLNNDNLWSYLSTLFHKIKDGIKFENGENIIEKLKNSIVNRIPTLDSNSFTDIISGNSSNNTEDNNLDVEFKQSFKYEYGLKEVAPSYSAYMSRGIYLSKPHFFEGNIKQVGIEVDEFNPTINFKQPLTSIEYYITNKINPSPSDWYSLLPTNLEEINREKYGSHYTDWVMGERIFPYFGGNDHIRCLFRFAARNSEGDIEIYKNGDRISHDDMQIVANDDGIVREIIIHNERFDQNNSDIFTANYRLNSLTESDPYYVDFEEITPITYIDENGDPGEKFNSLDHNSSIELTYHPYINKSEVFDYRNTVQESITTTPEGDQYNRYPFNPNLGQYSPNYDQGYMPLRVNIKGEFEVHDPTVIGGGNVVTRRFNTFGIDQDTEGVPYSITRCVDEVKDHKDHENFRWHENEEQDDDFDDTTTIVLDRNRDAPYVSNKTNYYDDIIITPTNYDDTHYPVIDYVHHNKRLTFAERLSNHEITVEYEYLVEGVRVKAILRRNSHQDSGYTPILYGYKLKAKEF